LISDAVCADARSSSAAEGAGGAGGGSVSFAIVCLSLPSCCLLLGDGGV
jgi:hypothetical protein